MRLSGRLSQLMPGIVVGLATGLAVGIVAGIGAIAPSGPDDRRGAVADPGAGPTLVAGTFTSPTASGPSPIASGPSPIASSPAGRSGPAPRSARPSIAASVGSSVAPRPTSTRAAGTAAPVAGRVALRATTSSLRVWRDGTGNARVHFVVSAANHTETALSLVGGERTYRIVSTAGRPLRTGRFAYAFPERILPGATSYLITTTSLPLEEATTSVRVEPTIVATAADATETDVSSLRVSTLRLIRRGGELAVSGEVRNAGPAAVHNGIVGVLCLDRSGKVVGGLYDNVLVASIPAGGRVRFETSYPGLPPLAVGLVSRLRGIAFDLDNP